MDLPASIVTRFWANVVIPDDPDTCWGWVGHLKEGRPVIDKRITGTGRKQRFRASRVSLQLHGIEIPDELQANHHCDNEPCCNPRHLYAGTQMQNMHDMWRRQRGATHTLFQRLIGTEDRKKIRAACAAGERQHMVAKRYGITQSGVSVIVREARI